MQLIETVRKHVEAQGIECEIETKSLVEHEAISQAESKMKISLPNELREFYRTVGDGLEMSWESNPNNLREPFTGLEIPSLDYLVSMYLGWREIWLYTPEAAEEYGFPHTKDPELAKRTAARMWEWLPVIEEGNGDILCLDLSQERCPVVFNKHDWLDGGTGDNGHRMAADFRSFLIAWASVCFQFPRSLYWPNCFGADAGVEWGGDEFRDPFRIAGLG